MIKLLDSPTIYVIATTNIDKDGMFCFAVNHDFPGTEGSVIDNIVTQPQPTDALPEFAGRVCYMSFDSGRPTAEYLKHILEVGHGSVLEHSNVTFAITGVSRSLTHELVRHRSGFAYSQLSQRFVNEENVAFVIPPLWVGDTNKIKLLHDGLEPVLQTYKAMVESNMEQLSTPDSLVDLGVREGIIQVPGHPNALIYKGVSMRRENWIELLGADKNLLTDLKKDTFRARKKTALESARSVLPNCTETKIVVTANLRAWRHFLNMRGSIHADREIRRLACALAKQLKEISPLVFQDVEVKINPGDGIEYVTMTYPKV